MKTAKLKDLKQKVLENLKTKGYHEYQLKELNPIIQATKQALNIPVISPRFFDFAEWAAKNYIRLHGTCQHTDTYYDDRAGIICKQCKCIIPE